MNPIVAKILKVSEAIAIQTVPGAAAVDGGIHALIDLKTDAGIPAAAGGVLTAIEAIKQSDVADEVMFEQGVDLVGKGYHLIRASLKHPDGTPTAVAPPVAADPKATPTSAPVKAAGDGDNIVWGT